MQKIELVPTVESTRVAVADGYMLSQHGMTDIVRSLLHRLNKLISMHALLESKIIRIVETGKIEEIRTNKKTGATRIVKRPLTTHEVMTLHASLESSITSIFDMLNTVSRETKEFLQTETLLRMAMETKAQAMQVGTATVATMENMMDKLPKEFRTKLAGAIKKRLMQASDGEFREVVK